jgi:TatD DNase family protein
MNDGRFCNEKPIAARSPGSKTRMRVKLSNLLVDTHAHLCDPCFDADRAEVLQRAYRRGVAAVVAVSEDLADARKTIELGRRHSMLRPAAGLYPTRLDLAATERICNFIRRHRRCLAAIGEVGLDFWKVQNESQRAIQRNIFREFIKLSREQDLPLNVHSRSAGKHAVRMLLNGDAVRVQMHAFDGKASAALPAVEAGYFFSIPPSVIRSRQKQKLVHRLPLQQILVETDSPVLGPDPRTRNEPANLLVALQKIAEIKEMPLDVVATAMAANTARLYGDLILPNHPESDPLTGGRRPPEF